MAKRAPIDEQPHRPLLDPGVISAALQQNTPFAQQAKAPADAPGHAANVVEFIKPEEAQPTDQPSADAQEEERQRSIRALEIVEKFDQEKRMLLTRAEAASLDGLVSSLAERLNTQVKLSHVLRALVMLALNAEREVDKRAGDVRGLTRPPNGDPKALQRFEKEIARVLGSAIRDAGPVR